MKKRFLAAFVFMFLFVSVWVMADKTANNPVTVSPGSETEVVTVWQSCLTFSWSAVNQAASYRVAVFESVDANHATYETMAAMASPVVSKDIPGPALSWTLSADEKLKTGGQYTWYVQALDVNGNTLGPWSGGRIFRVEQELRFAGIAERLGEVLKSYGVKDETITNVLADMKTEVQEVVINGIKGYEGGTNTFYGLGSGASITSGTNNTLIGANAGYSNTTGGANTFIGTSAGYTNTTGFGNSFLGGFAGYNSTGNYNNFLGHNSGYTNTSGYSNNFLGYLAGYANTTGYQNVFLGHATGRDNTTGYHNTYLGDYAGYSNSTGSGNLCLGYNAGFDETGSNKLYISNSDASFPLIYGDFSSSIVAVNGKLGVGRQTPSYPIHMASGAYCSVGGTWTNASSRSLKENIENLSVDEAVEALTKLNPVKYNYTVDKTDKHVGFIAEDVPDLVASADRKGLSPMDVTAVLAKVVQEQRKEIQDYKKIISDLQERMAKLEKK